MNKIIFVILSLILMEFGSLSADTSVEFRTAAFIPTSSLFRNIYGNAAACYQLEAATYINDRIDAWANIDWLTKQGRSEGLNESTRINVFNFSLGVKFPYRFSQRFQIYAGLGPNLSTVWLNNKSHCTHSDASKVGVGLVVKTGFNYTFYQNFFIDVFADYFYQPIHFNRHVDIGGFKTGAGIGYRF